MNPWMIAALLAGVIGVATLAKNAAQAALPRVTSFGLTYFPIPGVASLWDLWVTSLSGLTGSAMLARIPGGQMIYIPAALVKQQPTNVDWTYTFTPRGQAATFTIVVPAAILQAYAVAPKSALQATAVQSHAAMAGTANYAAQSTYVQLLLQGNTPEQAKAIMAGQQTGPASALADAQQLVKDVQALIASFAQNNGDAGSIGIWALTNLPNLIGIISKVQNTISAIQSGNIANAADIQQALQTALSQLQQMQTQAQAAPPPG